MITNGIVQSWIPSSKTLSITNIYNEFSNSYPIIGQTSNAQFNLISFDPLNNPSNKELYDNSYINTQANTIIVNTEINPLGGI